MSIQTTASYFRSFRCVFDAVLTTITVVKWENWRNSRNLTDGRNSTDFQNHIVVSATHGNTFHQEFGCVAAMIRTFIAKITTRYRINPFSFWFLNIWVFRGVVHFSKYDGIIRVCTITYEGNLLVRTSSQIIRNTLLFVLPAFRKLDRLFLKALKSNRYFIVKIQMTFA